MDLAFAFSWGAVGGALLTAAALVLTVWGFGHLAGAERAGQCRTSEAE